MTTHRLWCSVALLLLTPVLAARAADTDAPGEPLPAGAKARLGTSLKVAGPNVYYVQHLLAPDFRTYLVGGGGIRGPRIRDLLTGKATDVPGFAPADQFGQAGNRQDGRTIKAVSADGTRAVTEGSPGQYLVFEIATGKEVGTGAHDPTNTGMSLSADGKVLAFDAAGKGATREVIVWDVEKNVQRARVGGLRGRVVLTLLSPDGKTLATSAAELQVPTVFQLWEVASGKLIATLPNDQIGGPAAFSPDGKTLATADDSNGAVQLWDATTGKPGALLLGRSERLDRLAFSPDGKTLAALARTWVIERWALPDGKLLKPTPFPLADQLPPEPFPTVTGLAFVDNDRAIAWGVRWEAALVWEAPSGKLLTLVTGHVGAVTAVRFTAGGKEVVTAGVDRRVLRWDAATGRRTEVIVATQKQQSFSYLAQFPYLHLSPDGGRGLRDRSLFDVAAGEELFHLPIQNVTPSADFRRAVGFGGVRAAPNSPFLYDVWDLEDRRRVARLEAPATVISPGDGATVFSPDSSRLVAAVSVNEAIAVNEMGARRPLLVVGWDVATGKRLGELREPMPLGGYGQEDRPHLAAASNNSGVVLATGDGKLWVADYERGTRGETLAELTGLRQRFVHPTFSPDGKVFAVGAPTDKPDSYAVRVYDWPRGKLLHTFAGHYARVTALAFAPDGKTLASGSADGSVLIWDTAAVSAPK